MTDTSTETTVSDPDELEVDEPQVDTEPPDWLVIAGLCDCNHVALSIAHPECFDADESIEPVHDNEVVAYGARWQALVAPLAITMAERSGLPISAMCTSVYLPLRGQDHLGGYWWDRHGGADVPAPTEQEQTAEQKEATEQKEAAEQNRAAEQKKIVDEVDRIVNTMRLPSGVRVRGRYDFCGAKHPSRDDTSCRRGVDHDGDHNAYTYSIAVPETWPAVPVPVLVDLDDGDVA